MSTSLIALLRKQLPSHLRRFPAHGGPLPQRRRQLIARGASKAATVDELAFAIQTANAKPWL